MSTDWGRNQSENDSPVPEQTETNKNCIFGFEINLLKCM